MAFEVALGTFRFDPADREDDEPGAGTWIVQLITPVRHADAKRLRATYGVRLTDYVPALAYIERIPNEVAEALRHDPLVRAVAPYTSELKIGDAVRRVQDRRRDEPTATDFDAVLFDDADAEAVAAAIEPISAVPVRTFDDRGRAGRAVVRFALTDVDAVADVTAINAVRWVEPVLEGVDDGPGDPATAVSGPQPAIAGLEQAWVHGLHGEGQVIAVIDKGPPDLDHCFFADPADGNVPGPAHRKVVALRNATDTAPQGHATFVAGCAAGDQDDAPGSAAHRGGAWAAKLVCGNRLDLQQTTLLAELTASAGAGASIHSNSWHLQLGGDVPATAAYDSKCADVDAFTWHNEDHLVLGACGNTGETQGPPGTAKNAISVAAATADGVRVGDGCAGPTLDGRRKPDLMLVGCGVASATVNTRCHTGPREPCASSYATPFAAAAAAIVRQYFLKGRHPAGTTDLDRARVPSGALLKAVLLNATVTTTPGPAAPGDDIGWGLVDLRQVLFQGARRGLRVWDVRNADGLATGDVFAHVVPVASSDEPLKVTLVWTDPPGTVGSADPVVNDLDLEVTAPDGTTVYRGNALHEGVSVPGGEPDSRNNVEMVLVAEPTPGEWRVSVVARAVHVGAPGQGFALALTGHVAAG